MLHSLSVLIVLLLEIYGHVLGKQDGQLACVAQAIDQVSLLFLHAGVYLTINETAIANDGYVNFYDMIQNRLTLFCRTNKIDCCRDDQLGDWYYPNGTIVESFTINSKKNISEFFSRSRSQRVVRLTVNQVDVYVGPPERGRFYCTVPDANDINQTLYVNIRELHSLLLSL